jgi:hypothetical protein
MFQAHYEPTQREQMEAGDQGQHIDVQGGSNSCPRARGFAGGGMGPIDERGARIMS